MNSLLEKPNFASILILVAIMTVGVGYVLFTLNQRPEMESFTVEDDYIFPFNFDRTGPIVDLPSELTEISGLCAWKTKGQVLAIQDEDGVLFVVDVTTGQVIDEMKFGKDRDYEGVTRKGDQVFVLETDGDIHYFDYEEGVDEYDADKMETDFSYRNDTEGIVFDSLTGSLLIVPKAQELNPVGDDDTRRGIYSFNLQSRELSPQPAYYVDEAEVGRIVFGKEKTYVMKPSGIAVDPLTGDLYVLSSVGRILVVINRDSEIKHVELLEANVFSQPEGITFNSAGELYISSEGRSGRGIIATIQRRPKPHQQMVNE